MSMVTAMIMFATGAAGLATPEEWVRKELARPVPLFEFERVRFELDVIRPISENRRKDDVSRDGVLPAYPGMTVRRHTLWALGPARWRVQTDYPGLDDPLQQYHDACVDAEWSWTSAPGTLTVTRSEWGFPAGMDAKETLSEVETWANTLLSAGLNKTRAASSELESIAPGGGSRFHAVIRTTAGKFVTKHKVTFDWDDASARGFVRRREVLASHSAEFVGLVTAFGPWRPSGVGDLWVTERADVERARPRQTWIAASVSLTQVDGEVIAASLRPPSPGTVDSLRGDVRIQTVADYTTRRPTVSYSGLPSEPLPRLPGMDRSALVWAWLAAGMGVTLIGLVIVRRRAASPTES